MLGQYLSPDAPKDVLEKVNGAWTQSAKAAEQLKPWESYASKFPGQNLETSLGRLEGWDNWYRQNGIDGKLRELEELKRQVTSGQNGQQGQQPQGQQPQGQGTQDAARRPIMWGHLTPDDFIEQDRLVRALHDMEQRFGGAAGQAMHSRWQNEYLPEVNRQLGAYVERFMSLMEAAWPEGHPKLNDVMNAAVAQGNYNFPALVQSLRTNATQAEDAARTRLTPQIQEELRRQGWSPPTAPPGGSQGQPVSSRRNGGPREQRTNSQLFQEVMTDLQKKHGPIPV